MNLKDLLPFGAFLVSVISLSISFWNNRRTAITGVKPVLVFVYSKEKGWTLQNIGNGPAMNIIIAQKRIAGEWHSPVRVPPIAKGSEFVLTWLAHTNDAGLGAIYTDFQDRAYTSICGNDLSRVYDGRKLPTWQEREIGRHWSPNRK